MTLFGTIFVDEIDHNQATVFILQDILVIKSDFFFSINVIISVQYVYCFALDFHLNFLLNFEHVSFFRAIDLCVP